MLRNIISRYAAAVGPGLVRQQLEASPEYQAKIREAAREARVTALEQENKLLFGPDWRPQLYRSTRGWIDVDGRPAEQDMIDLHEKLKARDER